MKKEQKQTKIVTYMGIKWICKQLPNMVQLVPYAYNGGACPKFGNYVFQQLLDDSIIKLLED